MTRKPSFDAKGARAAGQRPRRERDCQDARRWPQLSLPCAGVITKAEREQGLIYALPGRQRPNGWRLAHNHVRHGARTRDGVRGFRIFWIDPVLIAADASKWAACDCGWRPELGVHYARR